MSTKADVIRAELLRRFPCGEAPHGAYAEIGGRVGVTREYVRQVASGLGLIVQAQRAKPPRQCVDCGAPPRKYSPRCDACNTVTLACASCGVLFLRSRSTVVSLGPNAKYAAGLYYCSYACSGRGRIGKPHRMNARPLIHGTNAGYSRCKPSCDACRAAHAAYMRSRKARQAVAG